MPRFEPKQFQQEIGAKRFWPVVWLVGAETMKARELAKRIRKAIHGDAPSRFLETQLDGETCTAADVLEAAQSLPLGGGTPMVTVKRAERLKDPENLAPLEGTPSSEPPFMVILYAQALDGRKKSTKALTQNSAVVNCEAVPEADRGAWVAYLAKNRNLTLPQSTTQRLASLDPWTLDRVDLELARLALLPPEEQHLDALMGGDSHRLIQALLQGDRLAAEREIAHLDDSTDATLQTLGLLAWHLRQMTLRPTERWTLEHLAAAGLEVQEFDRALKQTPKSVTALWSTLSERLSAISLRS